MKAGRNDPCPCGSGKKYKKCCLAADQEASLRADATPPPPSHVASPGSAPLLAPRLPWPAAPVHAAPAPPPPPDPAAERGDDYWRKFEDQSGEGRIAVFLEALEDVEAMTDELAFGMLDLLHTDAVNSGDRTRFAECVDALRERLPDVYDESAHFYLSLRLRDALADGRQEVVPFLSRELASHAGREIDTFDRTVRVLGYHGQLSVLVEALRLAWPLVKSSDKVVPWGVDEFAERGASHEVLDDLEHTDSPDPTDADLLARVRFFIEDPREDFVCELIEDLTGKSGREWRANDFNLKPPRKKRRDEWGDVEEEGPVPDQGALNLSRLINTFVGYLRREEDVPFSRGELVREELNRYFLRRNEGDLDPHPSMMEQILHPRRKLPKPPRPAHPLCPERVTLDAHLGGLVDMLNGKYHSAAALFQAMPAWLRFLESQRLIDSDTSQKVMTDLSPLHTTFLGLWEKYTEDPLLYRQEQVWQARPRGGSQSDRIQEIEGGRDLPE